MALKAGYYGLKSAIKRKLEKLAADSEGMLVIKSLGDGLNLTDQGELDITITGSFDYSTTEFDTGQKWIDGKEIYGKVLTGVTVGYGSYGTAVDTGVKIDKIIDMFSPTPNGDGAVIDHLMYGLPSTTTTTSIGFASTVTTLSNADVIILYTKATETKHTTGGKK